MAEEKIFIQSDGLKIEALIDESPGQEAVVVTHPHPLYGGDMYNNVVQSMISAYKQKGFTTLRFNFRGVGRSEGKHGQGIEEQEDVRSALAFLSETGKASIDLAGYSFGSWVNALGLASFDLVKRAVMVSPPVAFIDFSFLGYSPKIKLVISASEDNIAPPAIIKDMLPKWNPEAELKVIQGIDHSYGGVTSEVASTIKAFLEK
ncbi:MAG: alpha/beta fold hydrolase [Deltaproteobacteria bacterium]|nr:alpha/beta fold hydrolase [Deltaproteobacteria bacterium]